MKVWKQIILSLYAFGWTVARPFIFRKSAANAHHDAVEMMRDLDDMPLLLPLLGLIRRSTLDASPVEVGGVVLPHPFILAAGWVKGDGFEGEEVALDSAQGGANIIPGWQSMPTLVGPVEFGSFTRWPRMGNSGTVLWRDAKTRSTQNRIGLKNPGAEAAAEFLMRHKHEMPKVWGINIAVSPGVHDEAVEQQEAFEAIDAFVRRGVIPTWFTLNLSCPNTEDDPRGNQTEAKARTLCGALVDFLGDIPLWVKVGPTLSEAQIASLMRAFAETGVRAVIATNTIPAPTPKDPAVIAGLAGRRLHQAAVDTACMFARERDQHGYAVDVIGCGGIDDGKTYADFTDHGIHTVQYLSAMIYRGPLAAALINREAQS